MEEFVTAVQEIAQPQNKVTAPDLDDLVIHDKEKKMKVQDMPQGNITGGDGALTQQMEAMNVDGTT